jgi:hypothetical protein
LLLEGIAITGNNVIVEEVEDHSNQFSLDINEAAQLLNDYIHLYFSAPKFPPEYSYRFPFL